MQELLASRTIRPMLEWLFSWEVTSIATPALVGAAFAVLALDDFKLAKLFFLIAAADAMGGMVMWGIKSERPTWQIAAVAFIGIGLTGVLTVLSFRYVDGRRKVKESKESHAEKKVEPTASLEMEITPSIDLEKTKFYVDLNIVNVGQLAARKMVRLHSAAIGSIIQPEDEAKVKAAVDERWAIFEAANEKEPLGVNDIGIGQKGFWRFEESEFSFDRPLTVDILKAIQDGRSTLFFFITLKYMDDLHPLLKSTACITYSKGIAVMCHGHNTMPL